MTPTEHARTLIEAATGSPHPVGTALADAGYASRANLTADGPDRLIALSKGRQLARREVADGPPPETADPKVLMQHRLEPPTGGIRTNVEEPPSNQRSGTSRNSSTGSVNAY